VLSRRRLDPGELERWLLDEGLARRHDGLLVPTATAIDLGGLLDLAAT
jgi:hypothetical protein